MIERLGKKCWEYFQKYLFNSPHKKHHRKIMIGVLPQGNHLTYQSKLIKTTGQPFILSVQTYLDRTGQPRVTSENFTDSSEDLSNQNNLLFIEIFIWNQTNLKLETTTSSNREPRSDNLTMDRRYYNSLPLLFTFPPCFDIFCFFNF